MTRKTDPRERRGLRESLEAYAQRLNLKVDAVRIAWRVQGLRSLDAPFPGPDTLANLTLLLSVSRVRIAPGVAIPCGPPPEDVIEDYELQQQQQNNNEGN